MLVGTVQRFSQTLFSNFGVGRRWLFTSWICKEAFDCHERVISDLKTHDNGEHLSAQPGQHFKDGVWLFTEFSGIDVPGRCIKGLADATIQEGVISTATVRHIPACERSKTCQRVLASFSDDVRPNHIKTDILDRLPKCALERLQALLHAGADDSSSAVFLMRQVRC